MLAYLSARGLSFWFLFLLFGCREGEWKILLCINWSMQRRKDTRYKKAWVVCYVLAMLSSNRWGSAFHGRYLSFLFLIFYFLSLSFAPSLVSSMFLDLPDLSDSASTLCICSAFISRISHSNTEHFPQSQCWQSSPCCFSQELLSCCQTWLLSLLCLSHSPEQREKRNVLGGEAGGRNKL